MLAHYIRERKLTPTAPRVLLISKSNREDPGIRAKIRPWCSIERFRFIVLFVQEDREPSVLTDLILFFRVTELEDAIVTLAPPFD